MRWLWLAMLAGALSTPARAERPLSEVPMEASPKQLLQLANERPAPTLEPYEVLLDEAVWTIDDAGRVTQRNRYVVRLSSQAAAEGWKSIQASWAPWHEGRPDIQVRVIHPDGSVRQVDPSLLTEAGVRTGSGAVFSDARVLKGPVPPPVAGSIVEQVVTVAEHKPFLEQGRSFRYTIGGGSVPTRVSRLVIDAPESTPIQWRSHGLPARPDVQKRGGRQRLTFVYEDPPKVDEYENFLPFHLHAEPTFEFSTARDWSVVARAYSDLLRAPMASINVKERAAAVRAAAGTDREAQIRAAFRDVQKIPYTSIAFGEGAIVPVAPAEVDRRGFADCKDKALLLVAILGELGITAHLALVRADTGTDVHPDLPGLDLFNHAIVQVQDGPWLDPTDEDVPYGELPYIDQGRQALVIRPETTSLTLIPPPTPEQHRWVDTWDLYPGHPYGRATLTQVSTGTFGAVDRQGWRTSTETERFEAAKPAAAAWSAKLVGPPQLSDLSDPAAPMTARIEVHEAQNLQLYLENADLTLDVGGLVATAQRVLPSRKQEEEGEQKTAEQERAERAIDADRNAVPVRERENPLRLRPLQNSYVYRFHLPRGYVVTKTPDDEVIEAPGLRLKVVTDRAEGQPVTVHIDLVQENRELTPTQALELFAAFDRWLKAEEYTVSIAHGAHLARQEGRFTDAIRQSRADAEAAPNEVWPLVAQGYALFQAGFAEDAFAVAKKAAALAPDDARALSVLTLFDLNDTYGALGEYVRRPHHPEDTLGWLRRACRSGDVGDPPCINLANALATRPDGSYTADKAERNEAIQVLADRRKRFGPGDADTLWFDLLLLEERWADLEAASAGATTEQGGEELWKIVALAGRKGAQATSAEVKRRYPDPAVQSRILKFLSSKFATIRRYDLAAAFLEQSAAGSDNPMQARQEARALLAAKRHEDLRYPESDPQGAAFEVLRLIVRGGNLHERIHPAVLAEEQDLATQEQGLKLPPEAADLTLDLFAGMAWEVEGDPKSGWKVTMPREANGVPMYFAPHQGKALFVGSGPMPGPLGAYALTRVADDPEVARRWLGWAYAAGGSYCRPLVPQGVAQATPASLTHFAACLAPEVRPRLVEETLANVALPDPSLQELLLLSRLSASHRRKDWNRWLELFAMLPETSRYRQQLMPTRGHALNEAGRPKEAAEVCAQALEVQPGDRGATFCRHRALLLLNDVPGSLEVLRAAVSANPSEAARFYNGLGWFAPADDPRALADARTAVELSKYQEGVYLHTYAVRLLDAGQPDQAFEMFRQAVKTRANPKEPLGSEWEYVRAGLAEAWGMPEVAIRLYRSVEDQDSEFKDYSTYTRAQKRLAALGAAAPAKPPAGPKRK